MTDVEQIKLVIDYNARIIRVLKRGFYPASVAGDVSHAINWLKHSNTVAMMKLKELKNAPEATAPVAPTATEVSQPAPATE